MSSRSAFALLWLGLWIACAHPAEPSAAAGLDPSYVQALGAGLRQGLQFGSELVFTYGPLGWFPAGNYDPQLWVWRFWLWELALGALFAWLMARACWRAPRPLERAAAALALVLPAMGDDGRSFVVLAACWALVGEVPLLCLALSMACLSLTKFSMLPLSVVVLSGASWRLWQQGQRRSAWLLPLATLSCLVALWCVCGQALHNLPLFLQRSLELSLAYASAMSQPGEPFALLSLLVCASAWAWLARSERVAWPAALIGALGLYLVTKACWVRPGPNRAAALAVLGAALYFWSHGLSPVQRAARLGCTLLALLAAWAVESPHHSRLATWSAAVQPWRHVERVAQQRADLQRDFDLPRVREALQGAGVDCFSEETGIVLLNEFRWQPRPIFQAYSVWTAEHSALNAAALLSEQGPRFVLHHLTTLDERFPNHEDALSVAVLLEHFRPRLREGAFTLWERRAGPHESAARELVAQGWLDAGVEWQLPTTQGPLWLELDTHTSTWSALFGKAQVPWVQARSNDGLSARWRLLPELAPAGFLVAPLLTNDEQWSAWLAGEAAPALTHLTWEGAQRVRYRLWRAPGLERARSPEFAAQWRWSALGAVPELAELADSARTLVLGKRLPVLVVGAPSRLQFAASKARRVRAQWGVWTHAPWSIPKGALEFRVERGGARLWSQRLDPAQVPTDLRLQSLELALEPSEQPLEWVVDPLENPPESIGAFWCGLRFEEH